MLKIEKVNTLYRVWEKVAVRCVSVRLKHMFCSGEESLVGGIAF